MKKNILSAGVLAACTISSPASAVDLTITNEVTKGDFVAACDKATPAEANEICTGYFDRLPGFFTAAEEQFYNVILHLNDNAKRIDAGNYVSNGRSRPDWYTGYTTSLGYSVNYEAIEDLSFDVKLMGMAFGSNAVRSPKYKGRGLTKQITAGFIYTYGVKKNGTLIANGTFGLPMDISFARFCDAESKIKKCQKYLASNDKDGPSGIGKWRHYGTYGLSKQLAVKLLIADGSPFKNRISRIKFEQEQYTDRRIVKRTNNLWPWSQDPIVGVGSNAVLSTAGTVEPSITKTSPTKAQFAYAKMGLFDEVEVAKPADYLARASIDAQYKTALDRCVHEVRNKNSRDKQGVSEVAGTIGSLFGFGGAARAIRAIKIASVGADVLGALTGEDRKAVDSCLAKSGFKKAS